MQVNRIKVHKYLGITLDYTKVFQLKITMLYYINEIIDAFDNSDQSIRGTKSSDVPDIIFKVDKNCKKIIPRNLLSFITWWRNIICLLVG